MISSISSSGTCAMDSSMGRIRQRPSFVCEAKASGPRCVGDKTETDVPLMGCFEGVTVLDQSGRARNVMASSRGRYSCISLSSSLWLLRFQTCMAFPTHYGVHCVFVHFTALMQPPVPHRQIHFLLPKALQNKSLCIATIVSSIITVFYQK